MVEAGVSGAAGAGSCAEGGVGTPRIYYLHPRIGGGAEAWPEHVARAASLGFSELLLAWPFSSAADLFLTDDVGRIEGRDALQVLGELAAACRDHGLSLWMDLAPARAAGEGALARSQQGLWLRPQTQGIDPRTLHRTPVLQADFAGAESRHLSFWRQQLRQWQGLGVSGLRCHEAAAVPLSFWRDLLATARESDPLFAALAWMPGAPREHALAAAEIFDFLPSSVAWWDGHGAWLLDEYNAIADRAALVGFPIDPFALRAAGPTAVPPARTRQMALHAATLLADGWLMPMGFEYGMEAPFALATEEDFAAASQRTGETSAEIEAANRRIGELVGSAGRSLRALALQGDQPVILRQSRRGADHLVVLNRDPVNVCRPDIGLMAARIGRRPSDADDALLQPAAGTAFRLVEPQPIVGAPPPRPDDAALLSGERIAIEAVSPAIEGGRFAVKRSAGEHVTVEADIFSDGHDVLRADLLWRAVDEDDWSRAPLQLVANDRWRGRFPLLRPGLHLFAIEAWWGEFQTYRRDLVKKREAGLDVTLEIAEGRLMLERFAAGAEAGIAELISRYLARLDGQSGEEAAELLLADELRHAMERADPRPHATGADSVYPVEADREAASFSSWYELFPRSITDDPARHGTLLDVIGRLPAIREMGFDVLYFPPIHPIGRTNRKGRNNTLTPAPDDPGSPYAIGSAEGGHDALHPELGTFEDFQTLVRQAAEQGLELALDFAIQCSPDHPWLKQHPDWFQWRPDGSMRYAENPPKKYQDIVNVDFYGPGAIPELWLALRDVVQFWVDEGVRIFRVDNPHTKPFPFWEWLIADIRSRDPGVLFLAEAFTRPKIMYRLGKIGFSQSYTYFTWRNSKAELTEYLTELNEAPARDLFRPHFFVNTPDINPVFLQSSGRPGFLIRAALAATLSGLWGVYSGFELCESAAIPGKEEYLDSEKYEIKPRDWQAPGNIIAEIAQLNRIRRSHPALQSHLGLRFYHAGNDNILFFGKRAPGASDIILVAVNLDPFSAQSAGIEIPLWELGLPDHASVAVQDLMRGHRFSWHGKHQTIRLDPHDTPFSIWRIAATESTSL